MSASRLCFTTDSVAKLPRQKAAKTTHVLIIESRRWSRFRGGGDLSETITKTGPKALLSANVHPKAADLRLFSICAPSHDVSLHCSLHCGERLESLPTPSFKLSSAAPSSLQPACCWVELAQRRQ
jgi:hypothetical protein